MFDKLKELTKDTAIYGISTMVGRFLNFVLVPFYTNIFAPSDYGVVILIFSYIALLNIFFIYGLDAAFLKFAAFKDIGDEKDNFSTPYISIFFTSIFFGGIIILLHQNIAVSIGVPSDISYIIVLASLILFVDANGVIPFLKLRLERKAKLFSAIKITGIVTNIILNVILILVLDWGIEAIFISNLAGSFLALLLLSPTVLKYFRLSFHKQLFKRLLKFGLPYLPAGLAIMVVQVIDVPILESLTDMETVGIYKANYKLGIFMMLFVNMFQYAWQPFFLTNAKEENAKAMFSKVLTLFTLVGLIVVVLLSLFIPDLVKINISGFSLIGSAYWSGLYIVPVVLLAYLFNGLYVVFSAGIYIEEKTIYAPVVAGIGAASNIGINFLLIPVLGIMGAALATLGSYFLMALGYYLVTRKYYRIDYEYFKIAKMFTALVVTFGVYYYLIYSGQMLFIFKIIIAIIFVSVLMISVFNKDEFNKVIDKLKSNKKMES